MDTSIVSKALTGFLKLRGKASLKSKPATKLDGIFVDFAEGFGNPVEAFFFAVGDTCKAEFKRIAVSFGCLMPDAVVQINQRRQNEQFFCAFIFFLHH